MTFYCEFRSQSRVVRAVSKAHRWTGAIVAGLASCGAVTAGPPLSIDDPEILDSGTTEIIVASALERRPSGDTWLLPLAEFSWGIAENVQMGLSGTRVLANPGPTGRQSDFGPVALGAKWRFLKREALQIAFAPLYETVPRDQAVDRGVVEDVERLGLPLDLQYACDGWRLNAEIRYDAIDERIDEWRYGIAGAWPLGHASEALLELHGASDSELNHRSLWYRVGVDWSWTDAVHLLAAVEASLDESGDDDLDVGAYLGLQWFP